MSSTTLVTNQKGLLLALLELRAADGKVFPLSGGPFAVDVQDPANTVTVTPGSADQTTPTSFVPNGSNAVGTVSVTVTDQSNGLKGTGSFDVVAAPPPPPDQPDTLQVGFTPIP